MFFFFIYKFPTFFMSLVSKCSFPVLDCSFFKMKLFSPSCGLVVRMTVTCFHSSNFETVRFPRFGKTSVIQNMSFMYEFFSVSHCSDSSTLFSILFFWFVGLNVVKEKRLQDLLGTPNAFLLSELEWFFGFIYNNSSNS